LQFMDPPRIFSSIGHHTGEPYIRLCSGAIQCCAKHNKVTPMPGKAAATCAFFIRSKPGDYPNRQNNKDASWSADQQLLSPQRIPTLFRAAKRANLCRPFDRFSAKGADFGLFGFCHKLTPIFSTVAARRVQTSAEPALLSASETRAQNIEPPRRTR